MNTQVFQLSMPTIPPRSSIIVGDPKFFRDILTDPLTTKDERLYSHFKNAYGDGGIPTMFTTSYLGKLWHAKRKACSPAFSSNHIKRMNRVALEKTESWIKDTLMIDDSQSPSFDVSQEMIGIVLSALSETAFEYTLSDNEKQMFGHELGIALVEFARKSPVLPLRGTFLGWFIPKRRRAVAAANKMRGLAMKIMNEYRNRKIKESSKGTIIQLIMESNEAFPTDDDRAAQLLEFLVAGHDTTGYTISFILIELAKNLAEQTKLREALSNVTPENYTSCDQLKLVVMEGMRLHPVGRSVRVTGRDFTTTEDDNNNNNYIIPKGQTCILSFQLLFRNPHVFEDPDSFVPSRWINPTKLMLDCVTPFSLGKQNCIGQSLARVETFSIIARIISEYELTLESEGYIDFALTVKPVGYRLKARKV